MKKFFYKFLIVIISIGMLVPTWLTVGAQKAKAASSATGGGGSVVNGTTSFVTLNPFTITANNAGNIDSSGITLNISSLTSANLQFDTTVNSVTVNPSSNLNLGVGNGVSKTVTPLTNQILISVTTLSAPAGAYLTITGIGVHATSHGFGAGYKGTERISAVTNGGTVNGTSFDVDAQDPTINDSKITVTGDTGLVANTFKGGDSVNVSWDNSAVGDNNNDVASVGIIFSQFGGTAVPAVNSSDIWSASYILPVGLNLTSVKVEVTATDLVGNLSIKEDNTSYNVDTQNPIITISRNPNVDLSTGAYQITVDFGDATSDKQYQINSGGWTAYISNFTVSADGTYTIDARGTDVAGNTGNSTTSFVIDSSQLPAPMNLCAISGDREVTLIWDAVAGAKSYNIYYKKSSEVIYTGPVNVSDTTTKITNLTNGVKYNFIVRSVGDNGVESLDAAVGATPAVKVVLAAAPVVTAEVIQPTTPEITPQPPIVTPPAEQGQIKGEEASSEQAAEKINWTPWIILFILIILAGAATGGYFYWFGREEDEEIISKEVVGKSKKSAAKKTTKKAPTKRSKRW